MIKLWKFQSFFIFLRPPFFSQEAVFRFYSFIFPASSDLPITRFTYFSENTVMVKYVISRHNHMI